MEPIGLRFKHDGELMIVHRCLSCGKISNNRIAGDDYPDSILTLLCPRSCGNTLLTIEQYHEVHTILYGMDD